MTNSGDNPYAAPAEVDDPTLVDDSVSRGTWRRPNQPGKVACFWILGWTAFHAIGTLWVSGLEAVWSSTSGFAVSVFFAIGLFLGFELLRRLTLFACVMWTIVFVVISVVFLIAAAMNPFGGSGPIRGPNGPELTFITLNLFGTTVTLSPIYAAGIMAFVSIAPGYLISVLWGRRCDGKPLRMRIFSSFRNGPNSRESHHGKLS